MPSRVRYDAAAVCLCYNASWGSYESSPAYAGVAGFSVIPSVSQPEERSIGLLHFSTRLPAPRGQPVLLTLAAEALT